MENRSLTASTPHAIVVNSSFQSNCALSGSGIYNEGRLLTNLTIFNDHNTTGPQGDCQSRDGVIYSHVGDVDIVKTTFANNTASEGALAFEAGNVTVSNSAIHNNNTGSFSFTWSGSGGISNFMADVVVVNSTIAYNTGHTGGGILNRAGTIHINHSTIAHNTALDEGGGIYNGFPVNPMPAAITTVSNSVIEANNATTVGTSCFNDTGNLADSKIIFAGGNIISDPTDCETLWGVYDKVSPLVNSLDIFQTSSLAGESHFGLLPDSPAVDGAYERYCNVVDQLGETRPQDGNADGSNRCDSGAIERPLILPPGGTAEDIDADGMTDTWEITHFSNLERNGSGDYNNNGTTDLQEFLNGTDPTVSNDIDNDGMLDSWEISHFITLTRDGSGDYDGDAITDLQEYLNGTDPTVSADTDNDGLPDAWEFEHFGNLLRDGTGDFDSDGISDLEEFNNATSPTVSNDTDADGMPDAWEISYFGDISQPAEGDFDGDGVSNLQEYLDGTDPTVAPSSVTELIGHYEYGWVKTFGSSASSYGDFAKGVTTDSAGNIYVVGYFRDTVNFDRNGTNDTHSSMGYDDAFITRINADGSYGWTRTIGGANSDYAYDVAVDNSGNVYVVGQYSGSADFDIGGVGYTPTVGSTSWHGYISKYQTDTGGHVGTYIFSSTSVSIHSVAIVGDKIYAGGRSSTRAYVARLDTSLNLVWSQSFSGSGNAIINGVASDRIGNAYLTGTFITNINLSVNGVGASYSAETSQDGFVLKLNGDGSYGWSHSFAGRGYGVALNEAQDVLYITGEFTGTVDFNTDGTGDFHTSAGGTDIFLTQRQVNNGNYLSTRITGGLTSEVAYSVASIGSYVFVGGQSDWDEAHISAFSAELGDWSYTVGVRRTAVNDIAVAPSGNLYAVGHFNDGNRSAGSARFNPSYDTYTRSQGFGDVFITEHTFIWDIDQDGVPDTVDAFPNDPTETTDTDGDGIGNNSDPDIDGDGMPNAWETTYGFNPFDATDAVLDTDGDGVTNIDEYLAGSDPTVAPSSVTELIGHYEYGWVKTFGSSASSYGDFAKGVTTDSAGNIYVVGYFRDTVNFDRNGTNDTHSSMGYDDAFITRINADGSYGWTRTIGGANSDYAYDVAVDNSGNVYVVGQYSGSADFDIGGVGYTPTVGSTSWHGYISKYQTDTGGHVGTYIFSSTSVSIHSVAIVGDKIYAGGRSSTRAYVARLDTSLNLVWSQSFSGSGNAIINGVASDRIGNAYLTGTFITNINLSVNGVGASYSAETSQDGFVLKLNGDGSYGWSHSFAGRGYGVALNEAQDVLYITGEFTGTVDFNTDGTGDFHTSAGGTDIFLTQRQVNNGNYLSTRITGGLTSEVAYSVASIGSYVFVGGQSDWDEAHISAFSAELGDWSYTVGVRRTAVNDIAVAPSGNLYAVGHFNDGNRSAGSARFNPSYDTYTRSQGFGDVFITEHTFIWDTDQDGVPDTVDAFPNDPTRW